MKKELTFIESAMRHHRIVLLIVVVLVQVGNFGLIKMHKQEIPTITIRQGMVAKE